MLTKQLLIQILRNQLTDMTAVEQYAVTRKDEARHHEYKLRITQTRRLLSEIDPYHPSVGI
jgi:hypothetical protein